MIVRRGIESESVAADLLDPTGAPLETFAPLDEFAPLEEVSPEADTLVEVTERQSIPVAAILDIPYAFAKANGVVVIPREDGALKVALREGADPAALIETRRHLGQRFEVEQIAVDHFTLDPAADDHCRGTVTAGG